MVIETRAISPFLLKVAMRDHFWHHFCILMSLNIKIQDSNRLLYIDMATVKRHSDGISFHKGSDLFHDQKLITVSNETCCSHCSVLSSLNGIKWFEFAFCGTQVQFIDAWHQNKKISRNLFSNQKMCLSVCSIYMYTYLYVYIYIILRVTEVD